MDFWLSVCRPFSTEVPRPDKQQEVRPSVVMLDQFGSFISERIVQVCIDLHSLLLLPWLHRSSSYSVQARISRRGWKHRSNLWALLAWSRQDDGRKRSHFCQFPEMLTVDPKPCRMVRPRECGGFEGSAGLPLFFDCSILQPLKNSSFSRSVDIKFWKLFVWLQ